MAQQLYFSRDTKVFVERNNFFYEIPVLDGFTFSQSHNTSEITLNEAADSAGTSRRARQVFNDSFAPSEWSFSTYLRPFIAAGEVGAVKGTLGITDTGTNHHAVEEPLWDAFVDSTNDGTGVTSSGTNMVVNFSESNKVVVGTFNMYFVLNWNTAGTDIKVYKVTDAVVNEASIDFDIDDIAMVNWSGFGGQLVDQGTTLPFDAAYLAAADLIYEGVSSTNNFIRNKLTTLALSTSGSDNPYNATYDIVLTGGTVTLSNNISYLTPETLGSVNVPLGHVTGTRSVSGNFTAYLNLDTVGADRTAELFEDISEDLTTVTNSFNATFSVGGASAPKVTIAVPQAHLEIPQISPDDVYSVEVNFHGLPSTIDGTDEVAVTYYGIALN